MPRRDSVRYSGSTETYSKQQTRRASVGAWTEDSQKLNGRLTRRRRLSIMAGSRVTSLSHSNHERAYEVQNQKRKQPQNPLPKKNPWRRLPAPEPQTNAHTHTHTLTLRPHAHPPPLTAFAFFIYVFSSPSRYLKDNSRGPWLLVDIAGPRVLYPWINFPVLRLSRPTKVAL